MYTFYGRQTRNLSVNVFKRDVFSCLVGLFIKSTKFFSVVVRIYRDLVIGEAFFPRYKPLPWKVRKFLFEVSESQKVSESVSLLNIEAKSFNTIMQLVNPNYA